MLGVSILELLLSLHETAVNAAKGHSIDSTSLDSRAIGWILSTEGCTTYLFLLIIEPTRNTFEVAISHHVEEYF